MTESEDFLDYFQAEWNIANPAAVDVEWRAEWFDWNNVRDPQVIASPAWSFRQEAWRSGTEYVMRSNPVYAINVGYFIPVGENGTLQASYIQNITREIARIMRVGLGYSPKYGGSLTLTRVAIPDGFGRRLNELDRTPRLLRTEMLLRCTEDM